MRARRRREGVGRRAMVAAVIAALWALLWCASTATARDSAPVHRAYVWQRSATPALTRSLHEHARDLAALDVLAAEIQFQSGQIVSWVAAPNAAALEGGSKIAAVVRIGPSKSTWAPDAPETAAVTDACRKAIARFSESGSRSIELQIDFDASVARLGDYRALLGHLRRELRPAALTITALPAWLASPEFVRLVALTDAFVLQVHSLEKPAGIDAPFALCKPTLAMRWIREADRLGHTFRVALPTYGYRLAFDRDGRFSGLEAEGPRRPARTGTQYRIVSANPADMASLVGEIHAAHLQSCEAICWYRFPTDEDDLAWRWTTLAAVMRGVAPKSDVIVDIGHGAEHALDVALENRGAGEAPAGPVTLRWPKAALLAVDVAPGWTFARTGTDSVTFTCRASDALPLRAGERRRIGWLRLDDPHADIVTAP